MRWLIPILLLATPALAEAQGYAGHYYLQGVMETGSELMLRQDGRFQWYLVYGALDLFAEGRWREEDGRVILTAEKTKDVPEPGFEKLVLTVSGARLLPPDGRGAYVRPGEDD